MLKDGEVGKVCGAGSDYESRTVLHFGLMPVEESHVAR